MSDLNRPNEEVIAEVGGPPDESSVCLALYGPDLDPDEVTALLGCKATDSHRRGDRKGPESPPFKQGAWLFSLRGEAPTEPDQLFRRLLLRLPSDEKVWRELSSRFEIRVTIAAHFAGWNKGFELSSDIVAAIARMHATLGTDIYAYHDEDA
jgi:hypothetical protein